MTHESIPAQSTQRRSDFEDAWAKRPWLIEEVTDKDLAWHWWNAALNGLPPQATCPKEQLAQDFPQYAKGFADGVASVSAAQTLPDQMLLDAAFDKGREYGIGLMREQAAEATPTAWQWWWEARKAWFDLTNTDPADIKWIREHGYKLRPLYTQAPSPAGSGWHPIETNPFVSAKRFLITEADGSRIPIIGYRIYENGPWLQDGHGYNVYPTHWQDLPDTSALPSTERS